jgi:hypothetical protein
MGTRADFYVGRGKDAEWLGSIAWDGYPSGNPSLIIGATTEKHYRVLVNDLLTTDESATTPEQGWPWPWDDSRTTDYAYAWVEGEDVLASYFGTKWFKATHEPEDDDRGPRKKVAVFPNMAPRQKVTLGSRSGLITFSSPPTEQGPQ